MQLRNGKTIVVPCLKRTTINQATLNEDIFTQGQIRLFKVKQRIAEYAKSIITLNLHN